MENRSLFRSTHAYQYSDTQTKNIRKSDFLEWILQSLVFGKNTFFQKPAFLEKL